MRYLLDTNACVDYLNGRYPALTRRLQATSAARICTSTVVVAELRYGADRSARPSQNHALLDALLAEMTCVAFDLEAARTYGGLRVALERRGHPIGPYDMMIAAHALQLGTTVVTDNVGEFRRVRGLRIENWREELSR